MHKLALLAGIILTILLGMWLYPENCCQKEAASAAVADKDTTHESATHVDKVAAAAATSWPFLVDDANGSFKVQSNDQFNFATGSAEIVTPLSSKLAEKVARLKDHMLANSDRLLTITGFHTSGEPGHAAWPNLGLARANAVRQYLIGKGIPPNQLSIAGALDDSLKATPQNVFLGPVKYDLAASMDLPNFAAMSLKDADTGLDLSLNDNFRFKPSSYEFEAPKLPGFEGWWKGILDMFGRHDDKNLNIVGLYGADETNPSAFPNLGLARANAVKRALMALGLPAGRMSLEGRELPSLKAGADGWLLGPILYGINTLTAESREADQATYADIAKSLRAEPLVLYFETGASQLNLTAEQRQKFMNLVNYLDYNKDAGTLVVGHTDNTGNADANMSLGQNRADFIKQYLIRNGLSAARIQTVSKGQTQPIADNGTEQGRALNRRVVVTLSSDSGE